MWYTALIVLDVFLLWWATDAVLHFLWPVVFGYFAWLHAVELAAVSVTAHLPSGFVALLQWTPNVLVLVPYYMFRLPASSAFRTWDGWRWVRSEWFSMRIFVPHKDNGWREVIAPAPTLPLAWQPPHAHRQVLYAVAPHSVYAESVTFTMVLNELFLGVTAFSTSLLFWLPVARELASLAGALPATSHNISQTLNAGRSVIITPEGLRGALDLPSTASQPMQLLRSRKGFVRLALTCDCWRTLCIVPVYHAGADRLYDVWIPWPWLQGKLLASFYYPWPILHLGWWGTFWPKRRPLRCYYGAPIPLATSTAVVRAVDEVLADVCAAMEAMRDYDHRTFQSHHRY